MSSTSSYGTKLNKVLLLDKQRAAEMRLFFALIWKDMAFAKSIILSI